MTTDYRLPATEYRLPKPLLRGWFHAVAAVGAVVLTLALCWLSWQDTPRFLSMLVFGLSMVSLYTISAIYHIGNWRDRPRMILRSLDHSSIFLLIAGTYTPLCFNLLSGALRVTLLTLVWVIALGGMSLSLARVQLPRPVVTGIYIGMGWVSMLALPAMLQLIPPIAVLLLFLGGSLYTIGAIIYARRKPNPFPRVLGFHEIFHLFVIAGSALFATVIWVWVLPFPRS